MNIDAGIYRKLMESAAEGIVVVDVEGRIVLVNRKAEELFDYGEEELLGQKVEILLPEARREAHRGHRAGYLASPRNRPMGIGLDLVGRRRDGSEFPVEIALSHAGEGAAMLVMASVNDITRRKQWEEEKARFMTERISELEDTLHTLEEMARPPEAAVTTRMMGILPLRESASGAFGEMVEVYGRIMDEALKRRVYKSEGTLAEDLRELGARLGFLKATPRDVVELHRSALREKSRGSAGSSMSAYLDEGHFLLVELIGHLAIYYRNRAYSSSSVGKSPGPGLPGKGGTDGR
jgi:PAS domain S-box-containing protein